MFGYEISSKASAALTVPTTREKVGISRSGMVLKRMLSTQNSYCATSRKYEFLSP